MTSQYIIKLLFIFSITLLPWKSVLLAQNLNNYFAQTDQLLGKHVVKGMVDYHSLSKEDKVLDELVHSIKEIDLSKLGEQEVKAFWINAYNLLVIQSITKAYPVQSPKAVKRFFERRKHIVAGEKLSLNQLEQTKLLDVFPDGRLHFVLVCAAQGCPPILAKAYRPETLEKDLEAATKRAINNPAFVQIDQEKKQVRLSKIFKWYEADFKTIHASASDFIAQYFTGDWPIEYAIRFLDYDWTLNDRKIAEGALNVIRYRTSSLIGIGNSEVKLYQSVYTQKQYDGFEKLNSRSTYYSAFLQYLYGLNDKLNIGADLVFRSSLTNDLQGSSPFKALRFRNFDEVSTFPCSDNNQNGNCPGNDLNEPDSLRNSSGDLLSTKGSIGLSHIGPKIKFSPIKKWSNLSLQQAFYIPIQKQIDGQWISFTQLFYDHPFGQRSQLFFEASLWAPVAPQVQLNPFFKVFYSYFPTQRLTFYAMASPPAEYGLGAKFLLHDNFEIEFLYSYFLPVKFVVGDTRPQTLGFGIRGLF